MLKSRAKKTTLSAVKSENGEYLVPLKATMETLGGTVRYNGVITLAYNGQSVDLAENSVSDIGGKLYIPLNLLCSSFQLSPVTE